MPTIDAPSGVSEVRLRPARASHLVLAFLLIARMSMAGVIAGHPEAALQGDTPGYVSLATSLVQGDGYTGGPGSNIDLARSPGYPAVLALIYSTLGREPWKTALVQEGLGVVICLCLYWIGALAGSRRLGTASAIVFALLPNPILWSTVILSEALFATFVSIGCAGLIAYLMRGSLGAALMAGLMLGLAALARPVGLALLPAWILLAFVRLRAGDRLRRVVTAAALLTFAFLVASVPWMIRNQRVWGVFTVSSIGHWNLGYYMAPATLADAEGISLEEARDRVPVSEVPAPGEARQALLVILAHPVSFLKTYAVGMASTLFGYGRTNLAEILGAPYQAGEVVAALRAGSPAAAWSRFVEGLRTPGQAWTLMLAVILMGVPILVYVLAARGFVRMWKAGPGTRVLAVVLVVSIVSLLLPVGQVGNARFRVPIEPFLAVLAAGLLTPKLHSESPSRTS